MRDFLPADKARREKLLAVIRRQFAQHGFDEIETPVVEDSAHLHAGLGGDNEKLAYAVMKRGLAADDFARVAAGADYLELADLGLRFDLTVPLARFYASHHAELPSVFRSIQIAPAWRAERPQKGRYRQFMQCDIDVIGEPGILAEVELLVATIAALDALGLTGCTIRINDRRLLTSMLRSFGFSSDQYATVLITLDKLDKIGAEGVVAELRDRADDIARLGGQPDVDDIEPAIDAVEAFLTRIRTAEFVAYGERAIRRELPDVVDEDAVADLVALGNAVEAAGLDRSLLQFDPFLVRGMGYYTGTIFEVAHPELGYSLGGGGRYDGMIGRFLGTEVPAAGISLGFERLVDLVQLSDPDSADAVALLYDADVPAARLASLKAQLLARGSRVRLERRTRNPKQLLEQLAASGFSRFAYVSTADGADDENADDLEFRALQ
jgi:histidyl-tRNA synthetase